MKKLSIIVPCYNEEDSIPLFYKEIKKISSSLRVKLELIFVDDGSSDKSLEIMKELTTSYKWINYISFSRNFGKEAAMLAGLTESTGDYVTIMDVDLQDPPALLHEMIRLIEEEGYDVDAETFLEACAAEGIGNTNNSSVNSQSGGISDGAIVAIIFAVIIVGFGSLVLFSRQQKKN